MDGRNDKSEVPYIWFPCCVKDRNFTIRFKLIFLYVLTKPPNLPHCFQTQFHCVFFLRCSLGDDNGASQKTGNDDDDDEPSPSCGDYIMHFLTLFWKLLFAFIPPTGTNTIYIYVHGHAFRSWHQPIQDKASSDGRQSHLTRTMAIHQRSDPFHRHPLWEYTAPIFFTII